MTPLVATIVNLAVLAQEVPGKVPEAAAAAEKAAAGPITLSLLFVFLVIGFIAVKAYKAKAGTLILGSCIGVLGAGSPFVGGLLSAVIDVIVKLITSVATSIG
jgi:hypothetical protein